MVKKIAVLCCLLALIFALSLLPVYAAQAHQSAAYTSITWVTSGNYVSGDIVSPEYAKEKASGYDIFSVLGPYGFDSPVYALISNGPSGYKPFQASVVWSTDVQSSDVVYWLLPSLSVTYEWQGMDVTYEYYPEPGGFVSDKIGTYSGTFPIDAPTVSGSITYSVDMFQVSPEETANYTRWAMRLRGQTIGAVGGFGTCFPVLAPQVYYSYTDAVDAIHDLQDGLLNQSPNQSQQTSSFASAVDGQTSELDSLISAAQPPELDYSAPDLSLPDSSSWVDIINRVRHFPVLASAIAVGSLCWVTYLLLYGIGKG